MSAHENRAATGSISALKGEPVEAAPTARDRSYAGRFRLVYLFLAAAAAGVIGLAVHTGTSVEPAATPVVKHRWHPAGATTFGFAKSIARHYTKLDLPGFEAEGGPTITAERVGKVGLAALQVPEGQLMREITLPPTDVLYQISGHGREGALRGAPSKGRELRLRRLALQLAIDTLSVARPPKHVLVVLPGSQGWFVAYSRDDMTDKQRGQARKLLKRLAQDRTPPKRDLALLAAFTDDRIFAIKGLALTEDQERVWIVDARPCMDAACPGDG